MTFLDVLQTCPQALNDLVFQSNIALKILPFVWSVYDVHLVRKPEMALSFENGCPVEGNLK